MSIKGKIKQTENLKGKFTLNNQLVSQTVKLSSAGLTLGDLINVNLALQSDGSFIKYDATENEYVATTLPPLAVRADNEASLTNPGVLIGTDSLSILGTTDQIATTLIDDTLRISLPNDLIVPQNLTVTGNLYLSGGSGAVRPVDTIETVIDSNSTNSDLPTALAVKTYVDAQNTLQDMDISDGTNTISIDLDDEALTIQGTANETVTSVTGNTVTVGLASTLSLGSVNLTTALPVASGGTGLSALTDDSVMIVSNSGISFLTSTQEGTIIQFNANNEPVASSIIDGGSY